MKPFRSEIRNSPTRPTIKVYLNNTTLGDKVKTHLSSLAGVELIETRESIGRNRADDNITIFIKEAANIHQTKEAIDASLQTFFGALA